MTVEEKRRHHYSLNKEKIKQQVKSYYIDNKERINKARRERYQENRDVVKERCSRYRKENKERVNFYFRNRHQTDPNFQILCNLRRRLLHALKFQGAKKYIKTLDGIGCTPEFLRNHLESKFKEGMSWDNHGIKGWHVDHIRPCSSFDLSDPEEQMLVNHYSNLQPLWWWENLSKGNKYNF